MTPSDFSAAGVSIQKRDVTFLRDLFESRIMTTAHAAVLHFSGRREAAKKRLQKLKSAGLIRERVRRVNEPAVLFLTRRGISALRDSGILAEYPDVDIAIREKRAQVSSLTIAHELAVMDVKTAFQAAIASSRTYSIAEFCTWPRLHQFEGEVLVKPDAFVRIHEAEEDGASEHTFFVELDRSSEVLDVLASRCQAYVEYYKTGAFAERNGADRSAYRDYPFRVLVVLKSTERRNNLADRLFRVTPPILTQVYLTTFDHVIVAPLGAIWIRPLDVRDALTGTSFPGMNGRDGRAYMRQTVRDTLLSTRLKLLRLLEN